MPALGSKPFFYSFSCYRHPKEIIGIVVIRSWSTPKDRHCDGERAVGWRKAKPSGRENLRVKGDQGTPGSACLLSFMQLSTCNSNLQFDYQVAIPIPQVPARAGH